MVNLSKFRILKYTYNVSNKDLDVFLWDKMSPSELKWATKLTMDGVNDTGEDDGKSWDIILVEPKMVTMVDEVLNKYELKFDVEDLTQNLKYGVKFFSDEFMRKLDSFLDNELDVDGILDRMLDEGVDSLTSLEKYYLDKNFR
jgi:hypothetical protein